MAKDTNSEAKEALKKLHGAIDSIAADCPALLKLIITIGYQIQNYSNTKRIDPKAIDFGAPRWTNDGYIVFPITHKGARLKPTDVKL